jgi:GTPase SAR1 family protein
MAFVNLKKKEIQVKIVYYGPGRGGKTTNLEFLYGKYANRIKTQMATVKTHGDHTLYFDFLPFDIGMINGFDKLKKNYFVSSAVLGTNVVATLKRIISLVLASINKDLT